MFPAIKSPEPIFEPPFEAATRARLDALSHWLDGVFRIPGTGIRFGFDAILNLIPGLGTLCAKLLSAYLVWEARRCGASRWMQARMVGNVAIDAVLSAVPILGWFADIFFKANTRNMAMLRRHLETGAAGTKTIEGSAIRVS